MKTITKLLTLLLVFSLAAGALAACTPAEDTTAGADDNTTAAPTTNQPQKSVYNFTLIYEDTGLPAANVRIGLCQSESSGGLCLKPGTTDADGKLSYDLGDEEYGVWEIHIYSGDVTEEGIVYLDGYTFDNNAFKTSADVYEYTLKLTKAA